jgi:Zn-dependent protease with chaperone function
MTAALLAAYAVAAGFGGPAVLRRSWLARVPAIAITLWLTLAASWVVAVTLAALTLAMPSLLTWRAAGGHAILAVSQVPGAVVAGVLLAAAVMLRTGCCLASDLAGAWREQREHAAFLAAAGHPDRALEAVVLDDDAPAAYSLPRGRHRIVVSAATVTLLSSGQLRAVLAHERAHLRGHHQLALTAARALARAFPAVPLLARAVAEAAVLAEMAADDAAARGHDREDLAAALVILGRAGVRTAALTAGGPAALARIDRLLAPPARRALLSRAVGIAALAVAAAIACLPLIATACDLATRR